MPDILPITFVFALGEHVHWADGGQVWEFRWQILQRRMTQSLVTAVLEYLLIAVSNPGHAPVWAYESDLVSWHGSQL